MEPVLCYVEGHLAYFTTQSLEDQWGDDWDDSLCDSGEPYLYNGEPDKEPWEITIVAFQGNFAYPDPIYHSVEEINAKKVPWLRSPFVGIFAGTTLSEFIRLLKMAGGKVYREV